jgi:hypothetical protein
VKIASNTMRKPWVTRLDIWVQLVLFAKLLKRNP